MNTSLYYAQVSISNDQNEYRYTIRGNIDVPDCVDLLAESWETETQSWKVQTGMECISTDTLAWLAKMARVVIAIETTGDETKVEGLASGTP